jgi:hypothetical protein
MSRRRQEETGDGRRRETGGDGRQENERNKRKYVAKVVQLLCRNVI